MAETSNLEEDWHSAVEEDDRMDDEAEDAHDIRHARGLVPLWGVLGVAAFLGNGMRRVLPPALEPWRAGAASSTRTFWAAYVSFMAFMAYAEGYRGFHRKFSPMVVARALTLRTDKAGAVGRLLAPLYCMELFGADAAQVRKSWSVVAAVSFLVAGVKRLPSKPRSVVDAGVSTGLGVGVASLLYHYSNAALHGLPPPVDHETDIPEYAERAAFMSRLSLCPVTLLSVAINGLLRVVAGARKRRQGAAEPETKSSNTLTCPVSGKQQDESAVSCPFATFMVGRGKGVVSSDASESTAATEGSALQDYSSLPEVD